MKNKTGLLTTNIFQRGIRINLTTQVKNIPHDTNIENNLEIVSPLPEVGLDDQSNHENLNEPEPEDESPSEVPPLIPRRSNRLRIQTNEFLQSVSQQYLTFKHRVNQPLPYQLPHDDPPQTIAFSTYYDTLHQEDYYIQDKLHDPITFQAKIDKDTLYYSQAMEANDKQDFQKAIKKEFDVHSYRRHWDVVPLKYVLNEKVLDSVWDIRRKRNILTNEFYKHKARLNIHGGQQHTQ